jgi:hypothetical protein
VPADGPGHPPTRYSPCGPGPPPKGGESSMAPVTGMQKPCEARWCMATSSRETASYFIRAAFIRYAVD